MYIIVMMNALLFVWARKTGALSGTPRLHHHNILILYHMLHDKPDRIRSAFPNDSRPNKTNILSGSKFVTRRHTVVGPNYKNTLFKRMVLLFWELEINILTIKNMKYL